MKLGFRRPYELWLLYAMDTPWHHLDYTAVMGVLENRGLIETTNIEGDIMWRFSRKNGTLSQNEVNEIFEAHFPIKINLNFAEKFFYKIFERLLRPS